MQLFAEFEAEVQNALINLNDPTHSPGPLLARALHTSRMEEMRALLIDVIGSLQPSGDTPATARANRLYDLLRLRFIDELPQHECARRLGLSLRHLRREQQSAIHLIAERLWPQGAHADELPSPNDEQPLTWRTQLQQEFSALQQYAIEDDTNLATVLREAVALHNVLGIHPEVQVTVGAVRDETMVAVHPAVLEQIVFIAIDKLAGNGITREIVVSDTSQPPWSRITLQSRPASPDSLPADDFVAETMAVHGGRASIHYVAGWAMIDLILPAREKSVVLIVDDNIDLVHFYRRYLEGTEYEILHVSQGGDVWKVVARRRPDLIVLDLMLPDVNGWHLLHELLQHPTTSGIPVIVCSVIEQETLAKKVGAAAYLAKPVHRQAFIQTLDRVRLGR